MFTATKLGDSINKQLRRRLVTVQFRDGVMVQQEQVDIDGNPVLDEQGNPIMVDVFQGEEFQKDFQFSLEMTEMEMKKVVKEYLDELNYVAPVIADGVIDVSDVPEEPVTPEPTAAELDFQAWVKDRADLKKLKECIAEGFVPANTPQLSTLQTKVNDGWKNAYFNQI